MSLHFPLLTFCLFLEYIDVLFVDPKPIRLSSHSKLPRPIHKHSVPNKAVQASLSKTTSWATTLTAGSCNNNNNNKAYPTKPTSSCEQHNPPDKSETNNHHPAPSSSMMKRSKPFIFKNIQPIKIWTTKVAHALERLKATDLISFKKKWNRPYDKAEMSELSNTFIQSILFNIERLQTTEDPTLLDLCKKLLQEIGELRTQLNELL